jgi:20S proteasome subunit alpha 5
MLKELSVSLDQNMTLSEACTLSLKLVKQVMEDKLSSTNVEIATVTKEHGYQILTASQLQTVMDSLPK